MKRALISVSDKSGLVPFVQALVELGWEIIATGGTRKILNDNGIATIGISEITSFPEILDGRVKTLHPNVHAALLARRDVPEHLATLEELNIQTIDLVCVNLYPFKQTISRPDVTLDEAIENIDIGGPSMLRSAAKNWKSVTVICDPCDYSLVLSEFQTNGDTTIDTRLKLSAKVYTHTAEYDTCIAKYMNCVSANSAAVVDDNAVIANGANVDAESVVIANGANVDAERAVIANGTNADAESVVIANGTNAECGNLHLNYTLKQSLRYGENPHQKAAFYAGEKQPYSIAFARQIQGKELSYNNIQDANAALSVVRDFEQPFCCALKHLNPCGAAIGQTIEDAWARAYEADKVSIYGGIVVVNRELSVEIALGMKPIFLEIVIAPSFSAQALEILSSKKNLRILEVDMSSTQTVSKQYVGVIGGMLVQDFDTAVESITEQMCVTETKPSKAQIADLNFGWKIVKHIKSNAIAVVRDGHTIGVGAGQTNRVGSAHIALEQAREAGFTQGLILASDGFLPFDDTVALAAQYGVSAIVQPGGSIRDNDAIAKANELGITMLFTGIRHFKH